MKENALNFLRSAFPFLAVLFLWRASAPIWNPAGMLAIIPIFYCAFIRPTPWFMLFGLIFCFLLDYNLGTLCYWTALYCILYAINGFQGFIDITRAPQNGIGVFAIFFGVAIILLTIPHLNISNILRMIWMFMWTCVLYMPITVLIKRVKND